MNESNLQLFFENHVFDTSSTAVTDTNQDDTKMPPQHLDVGSIVVIAKGWEDNDYGDRGGVVQSITPDGERWVLIYPERVAVCIEKKYLRSLDNCGVKWRDNNVVTPSPYAAKRSNMLADIGNNVEYYHNHEEDANSIRDIFLGTGGMMNNHDCLKVIPILKSLLSIDKELFVEVNNNMMKLLEQEDGTCHVKRKLEYGETFVYYMNKEIQITKLKTFLPIQAETDNNKKAWNFQEIYSSLTKEIPMLVDIRSISTMGDISKEIHRIVEEFPYLMETARKEEKVALEKEKQKAVDFLCSVRDRYKNSEESVATKKPKKQNTKALPRNQQPKPISPASNLRLNAMVTNLGYIYDVWVKSKVCRETDDRFKRDFYPQLVVLRDELQKCKVMAGDVGLKTKRAAICVALKNLRDASKHKTDSLASQKHMICHVHQLMCLMMLNFTDIPGLHTEKKQETIKRADV